MQRTPLYEAHLRLGAKMVDFGGWAMPVSYGGAGILEEHHATRNSVGVFDVCHMGEIHFRGPRAREAVQRLVTNEVGRLRDGGAFYTVACLPTGGIVDDLIVYRVSAEHLFIVANAANLAKDRAWFIEHAGAMCDVVDASAETALIAFQGPEAERALAALTAAPIAGLPRFAFADAEVAGIRATVARTGYTGEDGFELFCAATDAPALWDRLVDAAMQARGRPVGLGARDTLRLEARLPLYGNDLDEQTTPFEAGLGWVVKLDAGDFIGREALRAQQAAGIARRLAGFVMTGRGIARHGYPMFDAAGAAAGVVSSGGPAPTLEKNIGMGYLPVELDRPGERISVDCRGKRVDAEIVQGPFYRRSRAPARQRGTA